MINKYYEKFKVFMKENYKFLIAIITIVLLFTIELPYVVYTPGGSIDLTDRVEVENGYKSEGSLSMAYVSMIKGNIPFLLLSYILPNWDIVPTKELKPSNETLDEMIESDQIALKEAQNNALYAAFSLANKKIEVKNKTNHLIYLSEEAKTDLKLFDEIISMNGKKIEHLDTVKEVVSGLKVGDEVTFEILRKGEKLEKHATVYQSEDGLKVGLSIKTTYEYVTDPKVDMTSKSSESGPSGGLMTALSIYNQLVEEDITGGKKIIGTGTIDQDGAVGEIGGIKYKILGAVKKKADIFLVPEKNYEEAVKVKQEEDLSIQLISVKNLEEAIKAIKN